MTHNSKDEDEKSLFRKYMHDVVPLKNRAKIPHFSEKPPLRRQAKNTSIYSRENPAFSPETPNLSDPYQLSIQAEETLCYHLSSLPSKRLKMLKKGEFHLDARLDLHGLYIESARDTLRQFILSAFYKGQRNLLIIHGKGGQQGGAAILKSHVAHWLKEFPQILAFHSAQAKDGGTGATYVLLKKK